MSKQMIDSSGLSLLQRDGGPPTVLASGSAPGESGVSILNVRFRDGAHFSGTPRQHLIWFQASSQARIECRIAGRALRHQPEAGSLAICPAGAGIAGRSPFHFTRVFTRSVGTTPHRYVVHLRLRRAIELVREGRSSLAEIAVRTGFADQSHLSRWAKRVHGVTLMQLAA